MAFPTWALKQPPRTMFERRPGTSGAGGQFYERELAMMMLLKGVTMKQNNEIKQFHLATNMNELGNFDDLVFKYKYWDEGGQEKTRTIFLQAKHKDNPQKEKNWKKKESITLNKLLSNSDQKAEFALRDYFSSFLSIRNQFTGKNARHPIFEGEFKDCEFVIYTNALLYRNMKRNKEVFLKVDIDAGAIMNFGEDCCYYQLIFGEKKKENKIIKDVLEYSCECKKLIKALIKSIFPDSKNKGAELINQGIIKKYQSCLAEKVIAIERKGEGKISDTFLCESTSVQDQVFKDAFFDELRKVKELSDKSTDQLKQILREMLIKIPKNFGEVKDDNASENSLPCDLITKDDIKDFLSKLKLFFEQPNYIELTNIIKTRIKEKYKMTSNSDVNTIYSKVNKQIEQWWMAEEGSYYLTEKCDYFSDENTYLDSQKNPPATNLPVRWQVPPQCDNFVGRIQLLDQMNNILNRNTKTRTAVCHGLGGVGKTQLALQFIWSNYESYKGTLWFNASDRNTLLNEYIKLGQALNITRGHEKSCIEIQAELVKIWLEDNSRAGWLMVCDNAPNYKDIAGLLPTQGGKILFTSRYNFAWTHPQNCIAVDIFELCESRTLIRNVIEFNGTVMDLLFVDELAKTLDHLPLALAQASIYIRKTQIPIEEYLKIYSSEKQSLLSSKVLLETSPAGYNKDHTATVYVTWDLTMSEIQNESTLASNWLTLCAYLNSNDISIFLLEMFSENPQNNPSSENFREALGILKCYSMLNVNKEDCSMSVHKLVQEVMLLKSRESGETQNDLRKALNLASTAVTCNIDHALSIWSYSCSYSDFVREYHHLPSRIIIALKNRERFNEAVTFGRNAIQTLKKYLGKDHYSTINAMITTSEVLILLNNYEEGIPILEEILEKRSTTKGPNHSLTLTSKNNLAEALSDQGKYDAAMEIFSELLKQTAEVFGVSSLEALYTKQSLADVLCCEGKLEDALKMYEEIYREIDTNKFCMRVVLKLDVMSRAALINDTLGKHDEALNIYTEILEVVHKTEYFGLYHPFTLATQQNIAVGICKKGNYTEAIKILKEVIERIPKLLKPDHPVMLTSMSNLAAVLNNQGKFEEALEINKNVFEKIAKVAGHNSLSSVTTKQSMAIAMENLGQLDEALIMHSENLEVTDKVLEICHPVVLDIKIHMANLFKRLSKYDEALNIFEKVYNIQKRKDVAGQEKLNSLTTLFNIATILLLKGKADEALQTFRNVIEINQKSEVLRPDHSIIFQAKCYMALSLEKLGKLGEALKIYEELEIYTAVLGKNHPFTLTVMTRKAEILRKQDQCKEDHVLLNNQVVLNIFNTETIINCLPKFLLWDPIQY